MITENKNIKRYLSMAIFGKNKDNKEKKENEEIKAEPVKAPETPEPAAQPAPAPAAQPENAEPAARKFVTPEGFDFNRYFLAERRIVLENVSYETHAVQPSQTMQLGGRDTIVAQLVGQAGVKMTYNRTLQFEPEGPFTISVSFAVMLVFNPGTKNEHDWKTIDLATEFRKACPGLVTTMMSRTTLLVAEITSAAGGAPIIPLK